MQKSKRDNPFRFAPSLVGLDVLHDRISAVVLRYKRKQWTVLKTVKKSIKTIDASIRGESGCTTAFRARKITEVLTELDVKAKQVVTSFSGSDMIVKIVSLPPLKNPEQELPQLMEYELERQLPIPLSQAAYDYQIQPQKLLTGGFVTADNHDAATKTKDETTVLLAAVRRSRLNDHLAFMESAGVTPKAVMPSFLMFLNALFVSGLLSLDESGFIGAVRLSESLVDVVVVEGGVLSFARSFALKAPFPALNELRQLSAVHKDGAISAVETPYDFLRELQNTLRDFLPPTMVICGERPPVGENQLEKLLIVTDAKSLPFNLTMEQLTKALAFPRCEHKIMPDGFAIGLATGYLNMQHTFSLNLLKPLLMERRAKEKIARKQRALRYGPVGATLALAITAIFLFSKTEIAQKELTEVKAAQRLFEQKVHKVADLEKNKSTLSRNISAFGWVDAGYPTLSYRLYQVARSTPQNVWLKEVNTPPQPNRRSFTADDHKRKKKEIPVMDALIVTGYAPSQADIDDFIQQLRKLPCFSEVRQGNTEEGIMNKQQVLLFQLSLKSKPAGK